MMAVVVFSSPGPASRSAISYAMCWGRSPSGPPAEPMGKERIIELIIDSVVWKAVHDVERRMAGRSDDGARCFCRRSCSVSSFIGAGGSFEQRKRAAALILPSSSLAVTAAANAHLLLESGSLRPPG